MSPIKENKSKKIFEAIKKLPYFATESLAPMEKDANYLRVLFYRLAKRGKIFSLKRGLYASEEFFANILKNNQLNNYTEFIGHIIYGPSYLSLEYVLEKYGVLSEAVHALTLVTKKKTNDFSNRLGNFRYYHLKEELFIGFGISSKDGFSLAEASLAKALFDFLYLRKDALFNKDQFKELRLNLENITKKDIRELREFVYLEKSKRMKEIFNFLIKQ
jgi:predicted transcriptional regulator of viral defense system